MNKIFLLSIKKNFCLLYKFPVGIFIAILIYPIMKNKKIWVLGGHNGDLYEDNAAIFHQYLLNKNEKAYFYLKKESKDFQRALELHKNYIIKKNSIKGIVIFFYSKYMIYSHSCGDILNIFHYLFKKKVRVFLQHGVVALKKVTPEKQSDIYVTSTLYEYNIFKNEVGERLFLSGLPRFDKLIDSSANNKIIFYMPTWRTWEEGNKELLKRIQELIFNRKLLKFLKENKYEFHLYLHHAIQKYINKLEIPENIKLIIPGKELLQEELKRSNILVTDYSSVAWDFWYMDKPVIFYQYDQKEFLEKTGSYLDFNQDLKNAIVTSEEELILRLHGMNKIPNLRKDFKYIDKNNCERLYDKIKKFNKEK